MSIANPRLLTAQQEPIEGDEAFWLRRARKGDQQAFARIYQRHARAVHGLAWRLTADLHSAEDITQEAFLRLLRRIGGADPDRPLRPWLNRVASNLAIDRLRRSTREINDAECLTLPSPQPEPEACSEASGLLRHLPPIARTLVWLNQVEGWSHQSLGKRFGRSESWSKSTVSRALIHLRELANHPGDSTHES